MKELIEKSNQAAATFLDRRGYEIIEQPWKSNADSRVSIVAKDEDALVFTSVSARRDTDSFPTEHLNRQKLEGFAINWLKDNRDYADCPVRFDHIGLVVLGSDRALIKHHINAMAYSDIPEEE